MRLVGVTVRLVGCQQIRLRHALQHCQTIYLSLTVLLLHAAETSRHVMRIWYRERFEHHNPAQDPDIPHMKLKCSTSTTLVATAASWPCASR